MVMEVITVGVGTILGYGTTGVTADTMALMDGVDITTHGPGTTGAGEDIMDTVTDMDGVVGIPLTVVMVTMAIDITTDLIPDTDTQEVTPITEADEDITTPIT